MALTDFLPHPLWVDDGVDQYFVASPEAARRLQQLGVAPGKVCVTGIPIRPGFAPTPARPEPRQWHVLVMGGGLGLGPVAEAVDSLAALPCPELRVTVVCGANDSLRQALTAAHGRDPRLTILGYTKEKPALMNRSALLVTKPGGITCSEALGASLPMVLLDPLPGHEEENAAYLAAIGAAVQASTGDVGAAVATLLSHRPERLVLMRESARLAGRPDAAAAVANRILMLSKQNQNERATA